MGYGEEFGIAETQIEPCEEIMILCDRQNNEVYPYERYMKFPEQETREGQMQELGFREGLFGNEEIAGFPAEVNIPVIAARQQYMVRVHVPAQQKSGTAMIECCLLPSVIFMFLGLLCYLEFEGDR